MTATRSTRQRDVISRVLAGAQGPLSVPEVLKRAQVELPGLGVATVYRTLKLLTEQRRIHPVLLDGETRYEVTGRGHHHHFSCTVCARVFTLHTCPVALPSGTVYPGGFVVEAHEITLYGRCPDCAQTPSRAPENALKPD
ncbi:ferric uptake regulator, Fur family [Deinococcus reticulitermitis]|uniref:Ferric uptake regulator, Fur family n=1 Tax=Deinococcus reticulitermitis TaxID=856736 RepID=A0A1H6WCF6_9DEIO|nr:Fur family transcriptional regulator [Deinococcus reticulitermitis]SEJ14563.1 ferric uptake regulator, Fur family [Deinococcus reticulitermitis]